MYVSHRLLLADLREPLQLLLAHSFSLLVLLELHLHLHLHLQHVRQGHTGMGKKGEQERLFVICHVWYTSLITSQLQAPVLRFPLFTEKQFLTGCRDTLFLSSEKRLHPAGRTQHNKTAAVDRFTLCPLSCMDSIRVQAKLIPAAPKCGCTR